MSAFLQPEVTSVAMCWRIARRDGLTLGFTAHDRALDIDGLRYAALPGMTPSAVSTSDGLDVDTLEIAGALASDAITARDLAAGRYDGAAVTLFMTDWHEAGVAQLVLARGTLGEASHRVTAGGGDFTAELRGPTAAFGVTVIEQCSPECRAELGDARCRMDLAPLTGLATAAPGSDALGILVSGVADPARFADGRLRLLDGPNAGIDARIAAVAGGELRLGAPLPEPLTGPARAELREGCDKRFATCAGRFANARNFRGEPHVPGGDVLTRFPGG